MKKILVGLAVVVGTSLLPVAAANAEQVTLNELQPSSVIGDAGNPQSSSAMSALQPAGSSSGNINNADNGSSGLALDSPMSKQDIMAEADTKPAKGNHHLLLIALSFALAALVIITSYLAVARHRLEPVETDN